VSTTPVPVSLELVDPDPHAWPRRELDQGRVAEFMDLYAEEGLEALPPLELVVDQEGSVLLCDGHHRYEALLRLGVEEAMACLVEVPQGRDAVQFCFERAVAASARSAKPLSRAERRAAIVRLLRADPSRSDREVARITGASPTTVGRVRRELEDARPSDPSEGDRHAAVATAGELARRLFRGLERVRETRGFGIADALLGDRTAERFARVLREAHGERALERAHEYRRWIEGAIRVLEGRTKG
jgi:ParB-like chromosome segregation protein Spo0J